MPKQCDCYFCTGGSIIQRTLPQEKLLPISNPANEIRIVDPDTGGEKGSKPERYDLVPSVAMDEVARVYGTGAKKYPARNWEKGYAWGLSLSALERHLAKFKQGETRDELGNHHLAAVVFHALALITFQKFNLGTDDRTNLKEESKNV